MITLRLPPAAVAPLFARAGVAVPKTAKQLDLQVLRLTGKPLRQYETTVKD